MSSPPTNDFKFAFRGRYPDDGEIRRGERLAIIVYACRDINLKPEGRVDYCAVSTEGENVTFFEA
jgi:hypothetical protein